MSDSFDYDLDPEQLLLLVVGAHLHAEVADRPLAGRLAEAIVERVPYPDPEALRPVTCTDLWYVGNQELLARPTISIGAPQVNAATALLARRLPTVCIIDEKLRVHADPEQLDHQACIWGVDHQATAAGVELFIDRYLDPLLDRYVA